MQEKSPIKKKILQFIEYKGISKYKFYQKTGITRGVLDQNNGMTEENVAKFLAHFPDVNTEWLLTGKGEMLKVDSPEVPALKESTKQDVIHIYNGMPHECVYKDMLKEYKNMLREKEAEIKELNREIGALQARLSEKKTAAVRHHHHSVEFQEVEEHL